MSKINITLAQLQVFVVVAEVGSLTGAGQVLNLSQSGVSHALAGLEKALGLTLFERERLGVRLTDAGETLLDRARVVLADADHLEQTATLLLGEVRGTVRIGCFPSIGGTVLPALVREFTTQHPGVEAAVKEGTDEDVVEWLSTRQVDVGFVTLPNRQFDALPFIEDEFLVLVAESHPYAARARLTVAEIQHEPFILSAGGCEPLINAIFTMAGCTPNTHFTLRDMNTILSFVEAGLGVSMAPALALPPQRKTVKALSLEPAVTRHVGIAVRAWENASPLAKAFVSFARQMYGAAG